MMVGEGGVCTVSFNSNVYIYLKYSSFSGWIFILSVQICLGRISYIYAWISKLFDIVVVLEEEKCHLKHFLHRLKVKVTLEGHIN